MFARRCFALLIPVLFVAAGSVEGADGQLSKIDNRLIKEIVPHTVAIIEKLGEGETDKAIVIVEKLAGRKLSSTGGPFGDERSKWQRLFNRFATAKPRFESVELVGIQHISSQAHKISLVGHGMTGPMLFQFRVFEYQGKLQLTNVHFDGAWDRIEFRVATIKHRMSRKYPIANVETAEKQGAARKQ